MEESMKARCSASAVCLIALLSLPTVVFAGPTDAAVLRSSGTVAVNGSAVPTTSALFNGDKVQTAEGAVVTISAPGSTVLLPANSQMVFHGGALELTAGSASISTIKGMTAKLDKYSITPASSGSAKFEIKKVGSAMSIHSSSGVLKVSAPGDSFSLAEGATVTVDSATGRLNATSPSGTTAKAFGSPTNTSFFSEEGALSGSTNNNLKICENTRLCESTGTTSGHHPCVCRKL
jgi:hypothetical protein